MDQQQIKCQYVEGKIGKKQAISALYLELLMGDTSDFIDVAHIYDTAEEIVSGWTKKNRLAMFWFRIKTVFIGD